MTIYGGTFIVIEQFISTGNELPGWLNVKISFDQPIKDS